jgi:hypothetical protein
MPRSNAIKISGYVGAHGGRYSTTVNADSASGQPVLNVAVTSHFAAGQGVQINPHGARDETKTILSVQAGVSLTMTANLTYTHTAVQADKVKRVGIK